MSFRISQSQKYYRRFYRLVAFAVILMTAVLVGSLMLGDSVRGTLVQRVGERLGRTETIITSGTGFMSEDLMRQPQMGHAQGYLLMDGFVSADNKLLPVYVWGTDHDSLAPGEVLINEPLHAKLSTSGTLILHLPSHNLVPSGSLFVTKSYATQMRLNVVGLKRVEEGGNLLLKNEQTLPLNVFVNRKYLAEHLELEGRINLILSDDVITREQLDVCWTPEMSGVHLTDSSITSDGVFIPQSIVAKLSTSTPASLYFSYFVNELLPLNPSTLNTLPPTELSYSFVTAVSEWGGEELKGQDMILSDYAARRLQVREGDSVRISYYITRQLKNLDTREQTFRVKCIVPLDSFRRDSLLMADFPGLTRVEKCTDWDSDLPIDMNRIGKEDEDYWYEYRQAPKALVAYQAVAADWSNAFGSATAVRFSSRPYAVLMPGDADIQLNHPRAQGLQNAAGGVDFAGLFLSLGFFIILSAILVMMNPQVEMFTFRRDEILLYRQLGFSAGSVRRNLFREAFGVILVTSPLGIFAGLAYSGLTLWLLGNVWNGATHTEGFALHIQPLTIFVGWAAGLLAAAIVLWLVLRTQLRRLESPTSGRFIISSINDKPSTINFKISLFLLSLPLTLFLIAFNFLWLHSMVLFIICGLMWILSWGLFLRQLVHSFTPLSVRSSAAFSRNCLIWQSICASFRQHHLAYWTLALGVFTVFAVGLNRPDFTHAEQATGGYQYYVDSRVPIHYDLNNPAVRRKLSLQSLPDTTRFVGFLRHTQDEASCLNLNQVTTPTVLGVDLGEMEPFGLIASATTPSALTSTCRLYLDEESLLWSLKKSVGDTLYYQNDRGQQVPVVIAGSYPTGIFHGNAIMSREDFRQLWPKEVGQEVLLMKSSRPDEAAELMATAMSNYGLNLQTTSQRVQMFFEVTETYLIIFLTLGGLGLLLGIFSLMIIVRKNITAHAATIRHFRAMGFSDTLIARLLQGENILVPLYAVVVGATGAVISISANVSGAGWGSFLLAAAVLVALCILLYYGIRFMIRQSINTHT